MVPLSPLVWLINGITSGLLKLLRLNPSKDDALNTEELRTIVNEAGSLIPSVIRRCCSAFWIWTR